MTISIATAQLYHSWDKSIQHNDTNHNMTLSITTLSIMTLSMALNTMILSVMLIRITAATWHSVYQAHNAMRVTVKV